MASAGPSAASFSVIALSAVDVINGTLWQGLAQSHRYAGAKLRIHKELIHQALSASGPRPMPVADLCDPARISGRLAMPGPLSRTLR